MANRFVVMGDGELGKTGTLIAVCTLLANANAVVAAAPPTVNPRVFRLEEDYPLTHLSAGRKLYRAIWAAIQLAAHTVVEIPFTTRALDGAFTYDGQTTRFEVTLWALDPTAADTAASAIRTSFRTNNGV